MSNSEEVATYKASGDKCVMRYISPNTRPIGLSANCMYLILCDCLDIFGGSEPWHLVPRALILNTDDVQYMCYRRTPIPSRHRTSSCNLLLYYENFTGVTEEKNTYISLPISSVLFEIRTNNVYWPAVNSLCYIVRYST